LLLPFLAADLLLYFSVDDDSFFSDFSVFLSNSIFDSFFSSFLSYFLDSLDSLDFESDFSDCFSSVFLGLTYSTSSSASDNDDVSISNPELLDFY